MSGVRRGAYHSGLARLSPLVGDRKAKDTAEALGIQKESIPVADVSSFVVFIRITSRAY